MSTEHTHPAIALVHEATGTDPAPYYRTGIVGDDVCEFWTGAGNDPRYLHLALATPSDATTQRWTVEWVGWDPDAREYAVGEITGATREEAADLIRQWEADILTPTTEDWS